MAGKKEKKASAATTSAAKAETKSSSPVVKPKKEDSAMKDAAAKVPKDSKAKARTKANRFNELANGKHRLQQRNKSGIQRGTIYVGHIPDGFFESQMKTFFSQFGSITRLKLCRSTQSARSKGYGWIEFEDVDVAKIVVQTMHKYLIFGKNLDVKLMSHDEIPSGLWNFSKTFRNLQPIRRGKAASDRRNRPVVNVDGVDVPQTTYRQARRAKARKNKFSKTLEALGIEYSLEAGGDEEKEEKETKKPPMKRKAAAVASDAKATLVAAKKKKKSA